MSTTKQLSEEVRRLSGLVADLRGELAAQKGALSDVIAERDQLKSEIAGGAHDSASYPPEDPYAEECRRLLERIADRAYMAKLYRYNDRIHTGNLEFAAEQVREFLEAHPETEIGTVCATPCNQDMCAERDECLRPLVEAQGSHAVGKRTEDGK